MTPYSYHTFLFPFIVLEWGDEQKNTIDTIDTIGDKILSKKNGWSELTWHDNCFDPNIDRHVDYNEFVYFHENVRNAIFGTLNSDAKKCSKNNSVVRNFVYKLDQAGKCSGNEKSTAFTINKRIGNENRQWHLSLNAIRLKLFNTGVGILVFELENYYYRTLDDVLKINEYGRRIAIPYMSFNDEQKRYNCSNVADSIVIEGICTCDFAEKITSFSSTKADYNFISPIITDVLGPEFTYKKEKGKTQFHASGDDRMFVCCLINDDDLIKKTMVWDDNKKQYLWEIECTDKPYFEQSKIYDFLFIDGDGLTCIDRNMRLKLLREHLYTRFGEYHPVSENNNEINRYGTFAGITQHSMVCATNYVGEINPFLTMRIQQAILVLAQRASIIAFNSQAANLSMSFDGKKNLKYKQHKKIRQLQELHVAFRNQLLFIEATAQEQGIEMYDILQKYLLVLKEEEQFEKQLSSLYEIANLNSERRINNFLTGIAIVGGAIAITSLVYQIIDFYCK